jgi:hypothetical protein
MGGTQPKLPGTLPSPAIARKAHRDAVAKVREAEAHIENLKSAMRAARDARKLAEGQRRAAEDDLDAIDEGRRPG